VARCVCEVRLSKPPFRPYSRLFHIKALHLAFFPLEQQLFLIDHYVQYCQTIIHQKQAQAQRFAASPVKQEHMKDAFRHAALSVMQLKAEQWQRELAWAQALREQVLVRSQLNGSGSAAAAHERSGASAYGRKGGYGVSCALTPETVVKSSPRQGALPPAPPNSSSLL
jgi:hypothetical protein